MKGAALMHVDVCEQMVLAFTTEPLDGFFKKIGRDAHGSAHTLRCFGHIHQGADPGQGKNRLGKLVTFY